MLNPSGMTRYVRTSKVYMHADAANYPLPRMFCSSRECNDLIQRVMQIRGVLQFSSVLLMCSVFEILDMFLPRFLRARAFDCLLHNCDDSSFSENLLHFARKTEILCVLLYVIIAV